MKLTRIDEAIAVCDSHLKDSQARGTEVEIFLTRYLIVLLCATFEEKIEELVNGRAEKSNDLALAVFVRSSMSLIFRSLMTSEIAGLLGRFGSEYKQLFQEEMVKNQVAQTFFNNLVTNRHHTAHKSGSNLTFTEFVEFYNEGHLVLDVVERVLEGR